MIEIIKADTKDGLTALKQTLAETDVSTTSAVLIRFSKEVHSSDASDLIHNFNGVLRSFRYLAEKAKQGYDKDDARGQKMLASIDRHVESLDLLKTSLIDRIFGI